MIRQRPYFSGDLFGQTYLFEHRGEGLPMHSHERELQHNVIVLRGSITIYGPNKEWAATVRAGQFFDLADPTQAHEIAALEDDTLIFNVYLHGLPVSYKNMTPEQLSSDFERQLTIPLT